MSANEVIIDEEALLTVSDSLRGYIAEYRAAIANAVARLKLNSESWNDEDFNALVSAVNSFTADVVELEEIFARLTAKIQNKLTAIRALHNMKI